MNTTDKLAFVAIGVSIFTAIFSWYSYSKTEELSNIAFNRNYRPYVLASNFSFLKDNLMYPDMNTLMIRVLNAPAFITSKELSFYVVENNSEKLLFKHPVYKDEILYPLDNSQFTIGTAKNVISQEIAEKMSPKKLTRKVRIEYEWLSDKKIKYYFESHWVYNLEKQDWDIISQNAN